MIIDKEPDIQHVKPLWVKPLIENLGNITEQTQKSPSDVEDETGSFRVT